MKEKGDQSTCFNTYIKSRGKSIANHFTEDNVPKEKKGCYLENDLRYDCETGDQRRRDVIFTFTGLTTQEPEESESGC